VDQQHDSRWEGAWRLLLSVALGWVIPLGLATAVSFLSASISGLHGSYRIGFLVGVFLVVTGAVIQGGRLLMVALPGRYAQALDHDARRRAAADARAGHRWRMRSTASSIAAEIAGNRKVLQDAAEDRSYPHAELRLASAAWTEWGANLAGDEGAQEAHRLAADAYSEFARLNRVVYEDAKRFKTQYPQVMPAHRLDRTIEVATEAEKAVRGVGERY
jgi:hypothetical protein